MKKLSRLKELKALSLEDFEELFEGKQQKSVAYDFGVSSSMVSKEVCRREIKKVMDTVDMRTEFQVQSEGAWKNSPERYSFVEAGLMVNKSINFK